MVTIISILREVRDPREFNARHDLGSMLFLALAATLCGARSCVGIADFAAANQAELAEIVDLAHGTPSHDCFSRVFRLLDPAEMAQMFTRFAASLRQGLGLAPARGVVAIDGKRLRRGYERGRATMPPLMVSVWDAETRLSLAACAPPAGAHAGAEVAATLAGLKTVVLKGCVVTADALHCHPAMARGIRERGGHYALKLKGNNGPLHAAAIAAFAKADATGACKTFEQAECGHDRQERRRASVVAVPAGAPDFPDLVALGRIENARAPVGRKASQAAHYVALSLPLKPKRLLEVMRTHWSVENQLHWQLDVVFHEDDARSRKDNAPTNLSVIRRMAVDILRSHPDPRSPARKMNLARWKQGFFYQLFTHMR